MTAPQNFEEAVAFARELMVDDRSSFKQGYTMKNAAIAVAEVYGYDRADLLNALSERVEVEITWVEHQTFTKTFFVDSGLDEVGVDEWFEQEGINLVTGVEWLSGDVDYRSIIDIKVVENADTQQD